MPRRTKTHFTKMELAFIRCFSGDQTDAARQAGYKNPKESGYRLMKKKEIREEIEKRMEVERNESAAQLAKRVTVTRSEIINGLHKEAKDSESDSARVTAWGKLADIFKLTKPIGEDFEGWTDEELQAYVQKGTLPSWYGPIGPEDNNGSDGSAPGESTHGPRPIPEQSQGKEGSRPTAARSGKPTGRPN